MPINRNISIHRVETARIERGENGNTRWTSIIMTGPEGVEYEVTMFAPGDGDVKIIDGTAERVPAYEPRLTGNVYEPVSYREDMLDAGRGELLGE